MASMGRMLFSSVLASGTSNHQEHTGKIHHQMFVQSIFTVQCFGFISFRIAGLTSMPRYTECPKNPISKMRGLEDDI